MDYSELLTPAMLLLGGYILGKLSNRWRMMRLEIKNAELKEEILESDNRIPPDIEEVSITDPQMAELEHLFYVIRKGVTEPRWKEEDWDESDFVIDDTVGEA